MKLKEINRTAIQSWSPAQHHPVYLAAGTSAQQLDASFSTTASLEIFELDLADPSLDMKLRGAYSSSHRYHKLAWGPHGMDAQGLPSGVLIAGGENGDVILYDPAKIIAGHSDVVIAQSDKHSGPVRALDVNSFQTNLVASGGNESEIYIWDLNNFGSPMTPGPKTQPLEDISCVAWNRQVQHILASASPSGRASIWDLRKNDLIIKVSDHSNRMHCSGLEWNPEVATQLVLASEDDRMPVIQIWDLRFATSPLKVLENHTRGVLAIAWSLADPELLLSCGKDNRILCWNPNTAEVLYELPTSTQWCFDIQWCPRNPAVLSAAAFDGHISIYSIMGGSSQAFSQTQADTISTSFGNMDPFGMGQTLPPLQLPKAPAAHTTITPLKKPPKWIRRPVGASFAFGGKLVSLENIKPNPQQPQQPTAHVVHISQVITETTFLERSAQLQDTLAAGSFIDFCQEKIDSAQNEFEKTVWSFLKVNFENDTRGKYLELLGYKKEELAAKIAAALEGEPIQPEEVDLQPVSDLTNLQPVPGFDPMSSMPSLQPAAQLDLVPPPVPTLQPLADPGLLSTDLPPEDAFDLIAATNLQQAAELELTPAPEPEAEDPFDLIAATNLQQAAEPELTPAPEPEAEDPFDLIAATNLQQAAEPELTPAPEPEAEDPFDLIAAANLQQAAELEVTGALEPVAAEVDLTEAEAPEAEPIAQEEMPVDEEIPLEEEVAPPVEEEDSLPEEAPAPVPEGVKLCVSQGVDGLITQALLTGDFEGAVELCLHDNRMADSIILAIAGGAELLEKTQRKYFTKTHSKITKLISAVVMRDWRDVLQTCELQNWKEALAAVMTYAQPEEFSSLCDLLGCRLEAVEDSTLQAQACLCYICAGNVEKLVSCWTRAQDRHCPLSLQDLVEKVVVLRRAVEQTQESGPSAVGLLLGEKMSQYASLLASQGSLTTAIAYLPQNTEQVAVLQLRDRLSRALGQQAPAAGPALTPVAQVQPQLPSPQPRQLFAPAQPSMVSQQPAPAPVPAAAPAPQQYYQPVRSASTVTSWSNQTPTALPSVPPPPPHLGPATTEPQAQPTPAMYGMPPTGSAAPPDSSAAAYPPMYSHQYQPYPPASQYNPGTGGPAIYSPLQYSTPPPPSFSSSSPQAPAPGFMPQYTQQPLYPPPSMGQPVSSAPPSHPPFSPPPLSSGASFQHGGPGSPASYMPPLPPTGSSGTQPDPASQRTEGYSPDTTCFMEGEGPQNGWNDPPTLSRVPKKKKVPENYTPPSPITAPIFSPLGAGDPQQPPSMPPGQAQNQAPYQGMQQQQQMAPPPMNPGMLKTRGGSVEGAPGAPIGDVIHPLQSIPAEKITKKPIPEEHLILKSTFEGLIQKCLAAATDPQTKRKLDDANKRLEALYDKLREQTLSPAIVGGLHNMVQCIESRSYMESLNIHTHIVSSSNFSETSAFMPVLKVVLTQANKLGV
ncbi:protein transport protein Sec31A isoform X8 [Coregonus clupeaformis]|uniref:protein transport protein Sec31A isoform X8 n=1 Tax=Coregonus clupeaformis TaxID=59861 RepID=UPI001E1C7CE3|nr:protein transport protein Sec31A isoform X8 [Coregonus clupeaformis]